MRRGTNVHALGGFNQTVIVDTIRRAHDGLSRVEIARITGLSAQTVSNVSRRLLDDGVIREAGQRILGVGKPRTILRLDPSGLYAIGVHIDPSVITYVLLNLDGDVIAHDATRTASAVHPDRVIADMHHCIEDLISTSGVERDRVLGVGIAAPGPVNLDSGIVLEPPLLDRWHGVALRDALAEATGLLVLLEKDVTAAAVAELWTSEGRERDDFVFFYYGTGIGVGLALAHEVVRGSSSNAGDAGHIIVDPNGPVCSCGRRGCLGDAVMPRRLVQLAIERGIIDAPADAQTNATGAASVGPFDTGAVDEAFTRLAALAERGNTVAREILDELAEHIAAAVVVIVNLLDLDMAVFGGPYWERVSAYVLPQLPALINDSNVLVTPHRVEVSASAIGADVAAVGAACLVLDNTLSPRPATLLI
ncbi:ROK family protein [Glaciibacter superstes]|uniref:ROK family protein n=1 Tax=Glaciibacter superstes TaxID=501023 RepID=UPI0003B39C99|nr:ROK family protein [Glaciibacter superstes]